MIDSVLKGTGNSRFLKSAVPAGTSWADALAMLQAGTFPIDFNGINTEGFQQVGTPLNKANLLKDATAAQIGLPPSTTPDGMFQALGNTGELHVWRKTVNVDAVVPTTNTGTMDLSTSSSAIRYSKTAAISNSTCVISGDIKTLNLPATAQDVSALFGMFAVFSASATSPVYYIVSVSGTTVKYATTQVGKAPSTTYPVSTNPNAYQEGDDAKAAGYTLGEVETGKFKMSASPTSNTFYVNSTIAVTDAGTISFPDGYHFISVGQNSSGPISARDVLGNFMSLYQNKYDGDFEVGDVWFIPSDATITDYVYVTKRQLVTGYAAIPAGTTIEYLGKLGDKARVQVLSYVGTGTYGRSNPNSLTFDFVPKLVIISSAPFQDSYVYIAIMVPDAGIYSVVMSTYLGYESRTPGGSGIVTKNNKTITFYSGDNTAQLNGSGIKYTAVAIG